MGKRFLIWLVVCFCVQSFVVADKADSMLPQGVVFNEWTSKVNNTHFSKKIHKKDSVVKKQKKRIFKKFKLRTKIWTKMFPFGMPEGYEFRELVFYHDHHFYGNYLSPRLGDRSVWHSHRGPPTFF